jgi:hypothetical protein
MPQQAVAQILQIGEPFAQIGIRDLLHARARVVLDPLHRGFRGEAGIDGVADTAEPAAVLGEHAIGLEDLPVLARLAKIGAREQRVDGAMHALDRRLEPGALAYRILGDHLADGDARLVHHDPPHRQSLVELEAFQAFGQQRHRVERRVRRSEQFFAGREFGEHHGDRLQRLDLFLVVGAEAAVLHRQHPEHATAAQDGYAHQRMEDLLAGLRLVGEHGVRLRICQRQRPGMRGDVADQTLADGEPGLVHRLLLEAVRGAEFKDVAGTRQIDRAHLGDHVAGDDAHGLVEPLLAASAARHQVAQALEQPAHAAGAQACLGHAPRLLGAAAGSPPDPI